MLKQYLQDLAKIFFLQTLIPLFARFDFLSFKRSVVFQTQFLVCFSSILVLLDNDIVQFSFCNIFIVFLHSLFFPIHLFLTLPPPSSYPTFLFPSRVLFRTHQNDQKEINHTCHTVAKINPSQHARADKRSIKAILQRINQFSLFCTQKKSTFDMIICGLLQQLAVILLQR